MGLWAGIDRREQPSRQPLPCIACLTLPPLLSPPRLPGRLQCVPAHRLVERTVVSSGAEVRLQHAARLRDNKHVRYMWVPHTDAVVVVTCNEVPQVRAAAVQCSGVAFVAAAEGRGACCSAVPRRPGVRRCARCRPDAGPDSRAPTAALPGQGQEPPPVPPPKHSEDERLAPLRALLARAAPDTPPAELAGLSATQLRDALLARGPLDGAWVRQVNAAEAEYWRRW